MKGMNTTTQTTKKYELPVRVQFGRNNEIVIAGTPGASGEAGWSVVGCASRDAAVVLMAAYPTARMPCWLRIGSGEL